MPLLHIGGLTDVGEPTDFVVAERRQSLFAAAHFAKMLADRASEGGTLMVGDGDTTVNHDAAQAVGPFVINLRASAAPIAVPALNLPDCRQTHVYQIQRIEDGRVRYRLRLGPFAAGEEADLILAKIRLDYPGAMSATAAVDDLRAIAAMSQRAGREPLPANAMTVAKEAPPAPADRAGPVPVPREPAATPACLKEIKKVGSYAADLESTQTLRPLTSLELDAQESPRWFAVQLALAESAFDPDALPNLDIFSLYRLYSVAGLEDGRLVHALRLGFFGEESAARAVANYLALYYDKPAIKRVSVAERDRFAEQRVEARKDIGATGRHSAIEITDELVIRERRTLRSTM